MEARGEDWRATEQRIASSIARLRESAGPTIWPMVESLLEGILALQGEALSRILREAEKGGAAVLEAMRDDELLSSLLRLHGLHPEPTALRIRRALESVRPALGRGIRELALLGIDEEGRANVAVAFREGVPVDAAQVVQAIREPVEIEAPEVPEVRLVDERLRQAALGIVPLGVRGARAFWCWLPPRGREGGRPSGPGCARRPRPTHPRPSAACAGPS